MKFDHASVVPGQKREIETDIDRLLIGKELDSVLQSIGNIIEKGFYPEAEKVLVRYIEAAEKFGVDVDDSYGYLWPVCQAGINFKIVFHNHHAHFFHIFQINNSKEQFY